MESRGNRFLHSPMWSRNSPWWQHTSNREATTNNSKRKICHRMTGQFFLLGNGNSQPQSCYTRKTSNGAQFGATHDHTEICLLLLGRAAILLHKSHVKRYSMRCTKSHVINWRVSCPAVPTLTSIQPTTFLPHPLSYMKTFDHIPERTNTRSRAERVYWAKVC